VILKILRVLNISHRCLDQTAEYKTKDSLYCEIDLVRTNSLDTCNLYYDICSRQAENSNPSGTVDNVLDALTGLEELNVSRILKYLRQWRNW